MPIVYLVLGSNIGEKEQHLTQALHLISQICTIQKKSHIYLTEPVGYTDQDWFLNIAIEAETDLSPEDLLTSLQSIERSLGRIKTRTKGPRIIDIDILFYDDQILQTKQLIIPHPSVHERLFMLRPLMDVNPDLVHPLLKKSIKELYTLLPKDKEVQLYK
jgi:2-amino-4-hydroxy-6-hydroxymethyldihydropteridine diphosphokinase